MKRYYADGGGWNGKHSRWAITDAKGNVVMYAKIFGHDGVTNNVAEYCAVLNAMMLADEGDEVLSDSQMVVYQITGKYKCKASHLIPLCNAAMHILVQKRVKVRWVPREENVAGRFLDSARSKNGKVV